MSAHLKTSLSKFTSRLYPMLVMLIVFMMPVVLFAQNPDDNPGGNPDYRPPAVPLTQWMSIGLLAVGVGLGVWVIKRRNAKKAMMVQAVSDNS
ncbi:hypothetical protein LK994_00260 [Ferruginibacter lapsinanis]|uniref:hypothetical protein n=2 Tax=Ferruginibacter lapsinanis TaxID=563172 RepID=UPI001E5E9F72|nr:hypothetical protein [Ferruginibacter lapsinanis]UEG49903.1 hypothetical protein LK994_00260 [Ferruginibacter lapsinanis]